MKNSKKRIRPWILHKNELLLKADPWFEVYKEKVGLPDNAVIEDFFRIVLPKFAVIVAITEEKKLVMVRSYKHGPKRVCLSAPAGLMKPDESPLECAKRELYEETGYKTSNWKSLGHFTVDGNRQCGTAYIYIAKNVIKTGPGNEGDPHEEVRVELIELHQFIEKIRQQDVVLMATGSAVALAMISEPNYFK